MPAISDRSPGHPGAADELAPDTRVPDTPLPGEETPGPDEAPGRSGRGMRFLFIAALVGAAALFTGRMAQEGRLRGLLESTRAAVSPQAPPLPVAEPVLIRTVTARARPVRAEIALTGQVEPVEIATVAAEVPGRVTSRPVEQGDRVAKGQLLAALDTDASAAAVDVAVAAHANAVAAREQAEADYTRVEVETDAREQQARAQVAQAGANEQKMRTLTRDQELRQAEATLTQARTDERLARLDAARYRYLLKEGAIGRQQNDRAQAALDLAVAKREAAEQAVSLAKEGARKEEIAVAAAQVDVAKAGLRMAETRPARLAALRKQIEGLRAQESRAAAAVRQARVDLQKHRILVPFDGRVLATLAQVGEMLSPGAPVARLGKISRVKVTFAVPEESRSILRLGQAVTVTADAAPGRTFAGRVTVLGFQADPRSRTFPLEVTVENPRELLLPNMVTRIRLPSGPEQVRTLVPLEAVATDEQTPYVYRVRNGRAVRQDVTLGAPAGGQVEVTRGLEPGARIAATPQRLMDGTLVRVVRP